jgi:hypothetical protein
MDIPTTKTMINFVKNFVLQRMPISLIRQTQPTPGSILIAGMTNNSTILLMTMTPNWSRHRLSWIGMETLK